MLLTDCVVGIFFFMYILLIKVFSWNCRGAFSACFSTCIHFFIQKCNPDVVIIIEPCISGAKAVHVCIKFKEFSIARVEAQGFSGGNWFWWKAPRVSVTVLAHYSRFCV